MLLPFSLQAENYALSSSCGTFNHTTVDSNWYAVTNLSTPSLTVSGNRSVWVVLIPDLSAGQTYFETYVTGAHMKASYRIKRGSTVIAQGVQRHQASIARTLMGQRWPVSIVQCHDLPPAGTYNYSVEVMLDVANNQCTVSNAKLLAIELTY